MTYASDKKKQELFDAGDAALTTTGFIIAKLEKILGALQERKTERSRNLDDWEALARPPQNSEEAPIHVAEATGAIQELDYAIALVNDHVAVLEVGTPPMHTHLQTQSASE